MLFADGTLRYPARTVVRNALFGIEIEVVAAVFLLTDAAHNVKVVRGEIGLHHFGGNCAVLAYKHIAVGLFYEVFALCRLGDAKTDDGVDNRNSAVYFVLKIN